MSEEQHKTSMRSIFKKIKNIFNKQSDMEKEKKERNKQRKQSKPKGLVSKRIGMIFIWFLIILPSLLLLSMCSTKSSSDNNETMQNVNFLYSDGGESYATEFLYDYFNWDHEANDPEMAVIDRLNEYFINDIDGELDELAYDPEWDSSLKKDDIVLKDIEKVDSSKARFTFKVDYELSKETDEKDSKIDKQDMNNDEYKERMNEPVVRDGVKTQKDSKYISVPIYYDNDSNQFAVYDVPSFSYVNEGDISDVPKLDLDALQDVSSVSLKNNVESFLNTFFESYTEDSPDKLSYLVDDDNIPHGLNGTMKLKNVGDFNLYSLSKNDPEKLFTKVRVTLTDPQVDVDYENEYLLVIAEKDDRYIVESINDESYIKGLISQYRNTLDSNNEDEEEVEKKLRDMDDRDDVEYGEKEENEEEFGDEEEEDEEEESSEEESSDEDD